MFRWGVGSRDVAVLSVVATRPGTRLASAVEQIRQWRPGLPMLVSLAAGVLLATLTTTLLENWVTDMLLRDTVARASDQLELGVLGTITPADFEPPFDSRRLDTFAAQLEPITSQLLRQGSGLIRVNLFARDGTLLYSDTPARRGEVLDPDEAQLLKSALEGKPASQRSTLSGPENADLRSSHSSALEAYVPVTIDGDIVGAYELYQDLSGVRSLMLVAWIFVLGVTTALIALAAQFARSSDASKAIGETRKPGVPSRPSLGSPAETGLSSRELEVLGLLATTHSYRDIGAKLYISPETVRSHVKHILRKLDQPDRTGAVLVAMCMGILPIDGTNHPPGG